jgi:molybdopterin molybdotransferase
MLYVANHYHQSLEIILHHARQLEAEIVPFHDSPGRTLAETLIAERDDPQAPKSAMDGFAVRGTDTGSASAGSPLTLPVRGTLGAGRTAQATWEPGAAVRIMTGALLPPGADAVVKLEEVHRSDDGSVTLARAVEAGTNVVARGARLRAGDVVLEAGAWVTPQVHGLLASLGHSDVQVIRRPRVAVLAVGDELVEVEQVPAPGQIHVSNLYTLSGLVERYGGVAVPLGVVRDDPDAIMKRLRGALDGASGALGCDVVITLGGSRRGDFDFAYDTFAGVGAHIHFRDTRLNPGCSTVFASAGAALLFGLPGTPVPSWGAFHVLVRPALERLCGRGASHPILRARLTEPVSVRGDWTHFLPAWLAFDDTGAARVSVLRERGQGPVPGRMLANALICLPVGTSSVAAGEPVAVQWLVS